MKLSEIIAETIRLARAVRWPPRESSFWRTAIICGDHVRINPATIPELHELHAFLRKQTVGVLFAMTAIMYLGRDGHDDHRYDFLKSYTQISEFCENTDEAPDFLLVKVPLPDYLERGLDVLVAEGLDVDELLGSM